MSSPITFKMVFVEDIYGPNFLPKIGSDIEIRGSNDAVVGTTHVLEIRQMVHIIFEVCMHIPKDAPEWGRQPFLYACAGEVFRLYMYSEPDPTGGPTLRDYLNEHRLEDFLK